MYNAVYNKETRIYEDITSGISIHSASDFDKFWLRFFNTVKQSGLPATERLEMEFEDYETMKFERMFGAWKDEPFLGKALNKETARDLRSLRRFAVRKRNAGKQIYELLQDYNPEEIDFYGDDLDDMVSGQFKEASRYIIKLIGKAKYDGRYLKDEEDIVEFHDILLYDYELQWNFFDSEVQLINHYLNGN